MVRRSDDVRPCKVASYDAAAHREYVTGFRRRKQARRARASRDLVVAEKQARRDARRQRREVLRKTAQRARGLPDDELDDGQTSEGQQDDIFDHGSMNGDDIVIPSAQVPSAPSNNTPNVVKTYSGANDVRITTTVSPIETFAEANFVSRLPKPRASVQAQASTTSSLLSHSNTAIRASPPCANSVMTRSTKPGSRVDGKKKLTTSRAKKLSKTLRFSKIAKIRRSRQGQPR